MQIEVGKRYVDRKGRVIGPMKVTSFSASPLFGECEDDTGWYVNGKRRLGADMPGDLVAEYIEPVSPSEVSGKESTVEYDLSGIPAGYSFVGYRLVQLGDQYVGNVGGTKVFVATESDVTLRKLRIIVKSTTPPELTKRTIAIHKWLLADRKGKERISFGTAEWVQACKFKKAIDLGLYEEVEVDV